MWSAKFWVILLLVVMVSFLAGKQALLLFEKVTDVFGSLGGNPSSSLFLESDYSFPDGVSAEHAVTISWQSLLPIIDNHDDDISFSESAEPNAFADWSDSQYQSFIESINTNPQYVGKLVRIPGFIVPISLAEDRFIKGFFLVPYFGACVHFPPPPPNQMVYVQVNGDFPLPNVYNAYLVEGVLRSDVYEDPRGTSAYFMDLYRVTEYAGEPDDVRDHQGQQ